MKALLSHPTVILIFRVILGVVFIWASLDKIVDPAAFSENIDNYHATPVAINNLVALILPWLELLVGIGLISGVYVKPSAYLSGGMLLLFIILLGQALLRGINLHCGCFSSGAAADATDLRAEMIKRLIYDVIMLGMSAVIVMKYSNSNKGK